MDMEVRMHESEKDIKSIYDRLSRVEAVADAAMKASDATREDVGDLYDKLEELKKDVQDVKKKQDDMEVDVKEIKVTQQSLERTAKWLARGLVILAVIVVLAGYFAWRKGSEVPGQVVEAIVPVMEKVLLQK